MPWIYLTLAGLFEAMGVALAGHDETRQTQAV